MIIKLLLITSLLFNAIVSFYALAKAESANPLIETREESASSFKEDDARQDQEFHPSSANTADRFDWALLESNDFRQYIANLIAAGCPWETVKDLVIAKISRLYAPRLKALRSSHSQNHWERETQFLDAPAIERQQESARLLAEKKSLIKELLGVDLDEEAEAVTGLISSRETDFDFLPKEKRKSVADIHSRYKQMSMQIALKSDGFQFQDDKIEQKRIMDEMRTEMATVLTKEELLDYDLRKSVLASQIRNEMRGFQATEEEFRKIFEIRKLVDDEYGGADRNIPEVRARIENAERVSGDKIKAAIGPDRYDDFIRGQDREFRLLDSIAQRFEAPEGAAAIAYEWRKTVQTEVAKLHHDSGISQDQRQEHLNAIRAVTEQSFRELLGEAGFRNYQGGDLRWFERMAKLPRNTGTALR